MCVDIPVHLVGVFFFLRPALRMFVCMNRGYAARKGRSHWYRHTWGHVLVNFVTRVEAKAAPTRLAKYLPAYFDKKKSCLCVKGIHACISR